MSMHESWTPFNSDCLFYSTKIASKNKSLYNLGQFVASFQRKIFSLFSSVFGLTWKYGQIKNNIFQPITTLIWNGNYFMPVSFCKTISINDFMSKQANP